MYTQRLDQLGLVATVYDQLGISRTIDRLLPCAPDQKLSHGTRVKAMVVNCLGFPNRTLYLTPQFFENKCIDRLLAEGVSASQVNDDALGRTLDALYKAGTENIFMNCSQQAARVLKLAHRFVSLDATSFSVEGEYENGNASESACSFVKSGYSKDRRPDLKQVCLNLIVSQSAGIPLWMTPGKGNQSEAQAFGRVVKQFVAQLQDCSSSASFRFLCLGEKFPVQQAGSGLG